MIMSDVKSIEIQCINCKEWFVSPIFFGDIDSFDSSTMIGNRVNCPKCGSIVPCNKENMRVRSSDGGFKGIDTI